ncbi:MAG: DUF6288 domain-containing protein [Rubripirellula sp.]|nr:DUF6288 domain-containing protein [Rubripirellula sp.]
MTNNCKTCLALILLWSTYGLEEIHGQSHYENPTGIFSTRPDETKSLTNIKRFGPVGMGIDLIQPAFTMRISHIEEGSPAASSGQLRTGQIIESINDQSLAKIDPRIQLGHILAAAEASDGLLRFAIKGEEEEIVVEIPVLGSYSETWPLDCPKSNKIVRNFADYLSQPDANPGFGGIGMLFLLSTGEEEDIEPVRKWARRVADQAHTYAWYLGYGGIPLCEYYLRTGDEAVRPGIQKWVDNAVKAQYLDGWAGRGGVPSVTYGMGHLNAGGTAVLTFLLLAKECGAEVPEQALQGALVHFYRYSGRGLNPYGDGRPEVGFVDNGKNGNLAFAMAAAAALTPDGESSVYAAARDTCAMTSFYTTSFMLHGHTGGGIGESWRSPAMGLMHEKRPKQYREFMDNRQWHYDLSRRWDGSFGILGGAGYDGPKWNGAWGTAYALTYTIPRKTLRISGAPPTKYSQRYQLPRQPWGTEVDNAFVSLNPVPYSDGTQQDLSGETLAEDASKPVLIRLHESGEVSDDLLRRYIHHQDHNLRFVAANKVLGINSGYIGWRSPGGKIRTTLMLEFLASNDARVRRAMFAAISETLRREKRTEILTQDVFDAAIQAVTSETESWWVKDAALHVIGSATPDWVVPYVDQLLPYLNHEDWWLQNAALTALTPVVADERCYQKVLPPIGELVRTNQRSALTLGLMGSIREQIKQGSPDVHELAGKTLTETYSEYAGVKTAPGGQDISSTYDSHLEFIAASLADVPGGLDLLYDIARERQPQEILPYKEFFLNADASQFGPKLKRAIKPIITEELIPEFIGRNRVRLREFADAKIQSEKPGGTRDPLNGLAALYSRAGYEGYDWQMFADLRNANWSYHSFDPIPAEQVPWDQLITRYREVTLPKGMEHWFMPEFDPKKAGWKNAKSPFGNYKGELPKQPIHKCSASCTGPNCYGGTTVNSLWEHEVLLMRGTFKIPPLRSGHRYRISINDGNHVGSGGGHIIYINGKPLIESVTCNGRGSGGLPKGAYITQEFREDLKQGECTIAVKTFLRYNDKYKVKPSSPVPQGKVSLHLEEQKLPPMGDDLLRKSATVVAMLSSDWQDAQDPEDRERKAAAVKFIYDGKFVPNPQLLGSWKTLGTVKTIAEFTPEERLNPRNANFAQITFRDNGETDDVTRLWSNTILMDLTRYEALKIKPKTIADENYLFIEAGRFSERNPVGWQTSWYVLKKLP